MGDKLETRVRGERKEREQQDTKKKGLGKK